MARAHAAHDPHRLLASIRNWARELGFDGVGVAGVDLAADEARLLAWLGAGYHGEMRYMERHGTRRSRPAELVEGTTRVLCARMRYLDRHGAGEARRVLDDAGRGYVSRYALGRDYHKLVRRRLQRLCDLVEEHIGAFRYRVFSDSAPVLEKPLARDAGLGWIGKHTNLVARDAGSWFFLGTVYTDLDLPLAAPGEDRCGTCRACIDACPSGAIVAPYRLDARRCISYLTIELDGPIPADLRPAIGNRIFGCDDCQLVCPWNRFARRAPAPEFAARDGLDASTLEALLGWSAAQFEARTRGSAIRRIGHHRWLRNVAVAIGNAPPAPHLRAALRARLDHPSELVREHLRWALERQSRPSSSRRSERG